MSGTLLKHALFFFFLPHYKTHWETTEENLLWQDQAQEHRSIPVSFSTLTCEEKALTIGLNSHFRCCLLSVKEAQGNSQLGSVNHIPYGKMTCGRKTPIELNLEFLGQDSALRCASFSKSPLLSAHRAGSKAVPSSGTSSPKCTIPYI